MCSAARATDGFSRCFRPKATGRILARWTDSTLAATVPADQSLPPNLDDRRTRIAELLEPVVGSVLQNPTRGDFLLPNAKRYGSFLKEWGAIYERFGVPGELGLSQAVIESGLSGTRRSEARAIGFCQWLPANWKRLNQLAPAVIEGNNQTTQAPYCAAYLEHPRHEIRLVHSGAV